jgi:hypothetical protein
MADCETFSAWAAAENCPLTAAAMKYRNCLRVTSCFIAIRFSDIRYT